MSSPSQKSSSDGPDDGVLLKDSPLIRQARREFEEIKVRLTDPAASKNPRLLREMGREYARLEKLVSLHEVYLRVSDELEENRLILEKGDEDEEFLLLVKEEVDRLGVDIRPRTTALEAKEEGDEYRLKHVTMVHMNGSQANGSLPLMELIPALRKVWGLIKIESCSLKPGSYTMCMPT